MYHSVSCLEASISLAQRVLITPSCCCDLISVRACTAFAAYEQTGNHCLNLLCPCKIQKGALALLRACLQRLAANGNAAASLFLIARSVLDLYRRETACFQLWL